MAKVFELTEIERSDTGEFVIDDFPAEFKEYQIENEIEHLKDYQDIMCEGDIANQEFIDGILSKVTNKLYVYYHDDDYNEYVFFDLVNFSAEKYENSIELSNVIRFKDIKDFLKHFDILADTFFEDISDDETPAFDKYKAVQLINKISDDDLIKQILEKNMFLKNLRVIYEV